MNDPLEVFHRALACMAADDFSGVAACCDPVSLRAHQRMLVSQFERQPAARPLRIEDFMAADPAMPREVAEWNLRRAEESRRRHQDISSEVPGVSSVEQLRAMPPAEVYAAYLRAKSYRYQVEQHVAQGRLADADLVASVEANAFRLTLHVIGVLAVNERVAHVFHAHDHHLPEASTDPWMAREIARVAALPDDERQLIADLQGQHMPQHVLCRKQPDGTWLLIAAGDLFGSGGGLFISSAEPDDDDADDDG